MPTLQPETLVLGSKDVRRLLPLEDCIRAVEQAFVALGSGTAPVPGVLESHAPHGAFHVKTGLLTTDRPWFAAKVNANFPGNQERFGLPTIQGVLSLFDAERGSVLAVMDSLEITILRTAAATAVAAKHLARADSATVTICGCGAQALTQLRAVSAVRPVRRILTYDLDRGRAARLAADARRELGTETSVASDLGTAIGESDIGITCTPARAPVVWRGDVAPGAFVAAVGADNPAKQEIDPHLLAAATVVVDVLEQCAALGDLHHALDAGVMTRSDVYGELGEVVTGRKPGRTGDDQIIVFDSTGTALQDVAAAALVYERACAMGYGVRLSLAE